MGKIMIILLCLVINLELFAEYKLSSNAKIVNNRTLDINEGEIIVDLSENGKISKVVKENNRLVFKDASMEEAFEKLNSSYKYSLSSKDIKIEKYFLKGVRLEKYDKNFKLVFDNLELLDYDRDNNTKDDRLILNGSLELSIDGEWRIEIDKNSLKKLSFSSNFEQKSNFDVIFSSPIRIPLPFSKEFLIAEYEFSPVVVGPIVFTPIISIVSGIDVGIAGTVKVSFKNNMVGFYDTTFIEGKWYSNGNLDRKDQNGYLSFVGADGWIKGYIGPRLKIKFYDVVGPYMEGFGFIKTDAKTASLNPLIFKWGLYGGFDLNAGVSVKIFSLGVKDFEKNIYSYEKEIISGIYPKIVQVKDLDFSLDNFNVGSTVLNSNSIYIINSGKW